MCHILYTVYVYAAKGNERTIDEIHSPLRGLLAQKSVCVIRVGLDFQKVLYMFTFFINLLAQRVTLD